MNKKIFYLGIIAVIAVVVSISGEAGVFKIDVGSKAPEFTADTTLNKKYEIKKDMKDGKVVLLSFWASWCAPCKKEIPDLNKLQKKFDEKKFHVVAINLAENARRVGAYAEKYKMEYTVLPDPAGQIKDKYGIVGVPTNIVIDPSGTVKFRSDKLPTEKEIMALLKSDEAKSEAKDIVKDATE